MTHDSLAPFLDDLARKAAKYQADELFDSPTVAALVALTIRQMLLGRWWK